MTRDQAIAKALRAARKFWRTFHVVLEPGEGFVIADDRDLDTWFAGQDPIATVQPDGEVIED